MLRARTQALRVVKVKRVNAGGTVCMAQFTEVKFLSRDIFITITYFH